jgi:tripartite-type tricarboxylate transporter receptor subunit TctC
MPRTYLALMAPAGTPRIVIDRVHDDAALIMKDPRFRKVQLLDRGLEPVVDSVEQFARFLDTDRRLTGDLVQEAGIVPQ